MTAFRKECESVMQRIRSAVERLNADVAVNPLKPQDASRALKLNKNLTWKFARILLAEECFDAIPMLPGPEGVDIYLRAFSSTGADTALIDALRTSLREFDDVVARHFGNRAELDLVLDGMRQDGNLETSRRLAFRGAAGVFGFQVAARMTVQILVPTKEDPSKSDIALVAGVSGLRRLRPMATLPVFRTAQPNTSGPTRVPLFPVGDHSSDDYLVHKFSSVPHGTIETAQTGDKFSVQIKGGPVGRIGDADLFFAMRTAACVNLLHRPNDPVNEFVTQISVPCEYLVTDLFVPRSAQGLDSIQASIHATLSGPLSADPVAREIARLPIDCEIEVIEDFATACNVERIPKYRAILEDAFVRLEQRPEDYVLVRVQLEYPPLPCAVLVRWELPVK